jgi:hypothetical protein
VELNFLNNLDYFTLKAIKTKAPMINTLCTFVPPKNLGLLMFNKSIFIRFWGLINLFY